MYNEFKWNYNTLLVQFNKARRLFSYCLSLSRFSSRVCFDLLGGGDAPGMNLLSVACFMLGKQSIQSIKQTNSLTELGNELAELASAHAQSPDATVNTDTLSIHYVALPYWYIALILSTVSRD